MLDKWCKLADAPTTRCGATWRQERQQAQQTFRGEQASYNAMQPP